MDRTYWHKQQDKPLFADLFWSRPQTRAAAGKLLIIGGNVHGFAAVATAYNDAADAGAGTTRVILPDAIRKSVHSILETASFAPTTPSGSFARTALNEFIAEAHWADAVLLAGDLGRNSETAIVLESFAQKYQGILVITKDAVDYYTSSPKIIIDRPQTCLVLTIAQLQKLASQLRFRTAMVFSMDLLRMVDWLHEFTEQFGIYIVIKHLDTLFIACDGLVSTTKTKLDVEDHWRTPIAASAVVWWLQNPDKPFQALTSSLIRE